jgi:hypothetical protein
VCVSRLDGAGPNRECASNKCEGGRYLGEVQNRNQSVAERGGVITDQALTKMLFEAIVAAEAVYKDCEEWTEWARGCQASVKLERGAAIEASAVACTDADAQSGRRHFAALAAFSAAMAVAWAAGGEETAARHSCRAAMRNVARARGHEPREVAGWGAE